MHAPLVYVAVVPVLLVVVVASRRLGAAEDLSLALGGTAVALLLALTARVVPRHERRGRVASPTVFDHGTGEDL